MEENLNENNIQNKENSENNKHLYTWKHCLGMLIAAFIGGFLAIYFVTDQITERAFFGSDFRKMDRFERNMIKDFNRMYKSDMKSFDKEFTPFKTHNHNPLFQFDAPAFANEGFNIKSEYNNNEFKIKIDLDAFQGDESKVNYKVEGNKLTVFGGIEKKEEKMIQNISFSNDFFLPENADIANIKKYRDDNELIIEVPMKK